MTRVWTDGAEFGDLAFINGINTTGIAAAGPLDMSGAYCYSWQSSGNSGPQIDVNPPLSEFYLRFRYRQSAGYNIVFHMRNGSTDIATITWGDRFTIAAGALSGIAPTHMEANTTYVVEVHLKIGDAPDGILELKIDGILEVSLTGDTKPGAQTTVDNFWWGGQGNLACTIDDLALNNVAGVEDNSWCGGGRVMLLKPNGNGDVSQFIGSDANSVDNYLLVDEVPSTNDADYTESETIDAYDLYQVANSGLVGMAVKRVWAEVRARDTSGAAGKIQLGIKTGGAAPEENWSADIQMPSSYCRRIGDVYTQNPETDQPWTIADLDTLQVGVKARGS